MTTDPFAKIIRSKTVLDFEAKQRIADLLEPYLWLDPEHNLVVFKEFASNLTSLQRICVFLLAHKVKSLIDPTMSASVTPLDVEAGTTLPGGTVRPKLVELAKRKLIVRTNNGYEIAQNFVINDIEELLTPK